MFFHQLNDAVSQEGIVQFAVKAEGQTRWLQSSLSAGVILWFCRSVTKAETGEIVGAFTLP